MGLVFKWMKEQGGLPVIQSANNYKTTTVYKLVDSSKGYYTCPVDPSARSRMNVPIRIKGGNEELEKLFIQKATENGLLELKGHR